jgi:hemolysin D
MILAAGFFAVIWASFGHIDIVATARGKIVDSGHSKVIQSAETATVKRIHVSDGQAVRAGDVLIELDATAYDADRQRIAADLMTARLQAVRGRTMLIAMETGRIQTLPAIFSTPDRMTREQALLAGQYAEYRARLARIDVEITRREAELSGAQEMVRKLEKTVPIARQRAEDYRSLVDQNFMSKHGLLDKEQSRIEQEGDLATQRSRLRELGASVQEAKSQKTSLEAETRRSLLDGVHDAEQKTTSLEQELVKAETRERLMVLKAPVAGTVQQLAVYTEGGVVTPAQPLMIVVPREQMLEVEAFLENKDVGFINPGQITAVKVDTFPYTRYGTIEGEVTHVSSDAINDDKKGLVYATRIRLRTAFMAIEGKAINLTPGMAVTVEVRTGARRLIEYFLSPLLQYGQESLRER